MFLQLQIPIQENSTLAKGADYEFNKYLHFNFHLKTDEEMILFNPFLWWKVK